MKFLCVGCDSMLTLTETSGPDESGSLAVLFQCAKCGHKTAMLTNSFETQLVTSLGVKIGPAGEKVSKCPFSSMLTGKEEKAASAFTWTSEAMERLSKIPEFVRPMVQESLEKMAKERGIQEINGALLDEMRESAGGMFN